jgi:hypothetical protein
MKYYMATIKRSPYAKLKTAFIRGSLSDFICVEHKLGKNTVMLYHIEITEDEYDTGVRVFRNS